LYAKINAAAGRTGIDRKGYRLSVFLLSPIKKKKSQRKGHFLDQFTLTAHV